MDNKLTDAEWRIMNALWQDHPATARHITDRLGPGVSWAYTTVKTMLTRLVEKKAVSERKQGNASWYEPLVSRSRARRTALTSLANQAFDGAFGALMHFLLEDENLTQTQRDELMGILQRKEQE